MAIKGEATPLYVYVFLCISPRMGSTPTPVYIYQKPPAVSLLILAKIRQKGGHVVLICMNAASGHYHLDSLNLWTPG